MLILAPRPRLREHRRAGGPGKVRDVVALAVLRVRQDPGGFDPHGLFMALTPSHRAEIHRRITGERVRPMLVGEREACAFVRHVCELAERPALPDPHDEEEAVKKSRALMYVIVEAYRSGGPDGFRTHYRSLGQYDRATLAVLGNDTMRGMGMVRDGDPSERRCEVFVRACVEGVPLAVGQRLRGRRPKRAALPS